MNNITDGYVEARTTHIKGRKEERRKREGESENLDSSFTYLNVAVLFVDLIIQNERILHRYLCHIRHIALISQSVQHQVQ